MEQQARDLQFQHIAKNLTSWLPITDADDVWVIEGEIDDSKYAKKYDYVLFLRGFAYQSTDCLARLKSCLKPGGHLVLAVENRLGMKYLAGSPEEYTGLISEGINEYPHGGQARTYDKQELQGIFRKCGFGYWKFYYPYPDLDFPMEIYSDEWLPSEGALHDNVCNLEKSRLQIFDERLAFDKAIRLGAFDQVSNAYIIVLDNPIKDETGLDILYTRYSNDRNAKYAIRTQILQAATGERFVRKVADTDEGRNHIDEIKGNESKLQRAFADSKFVANKTVEHHSQSFYQFVVGKSLEHHLDDCLLQSDDVNAFYDLLDQFIEAVKKVSKTYLNMDFLLSNVLAANDEWVVIDYEWIFDVDSTPAKEMDLDFVIFRILHYYYETSAARQAKLDKKDFFGRYGISIDREMAYQQLEAEFQKWIDGNYDKLSTKKSMEHMPLLDPNELMLSYPQLQPWNLKVEFEYSDGTIKIAEQYVDRFVGKCICLQYDLVDQENNRSITKIHIERTDGMHIWALVVGKLICDDQTERVLQPEFDGVSLDGAFYYMLPGQGMTISILDVETVANGRVSLFLEDKNLDAGMMAFLNDRQTLLDLKEKEIEQQKEYMQGMQENIDRMQEALDVMTHSSSWKVTKPLRAVSDMLRK